MAQLTTAVGISMHLNYSRIFALTLIPIVLLIAACGSAPSLVTKTAGAPSGVDLSGQWQLRHDANSNRPAEGPGVREGIVIPGRRVKVQRNRGGNDRSVQVFLEFGDSLKITQTAFGIFISYDRSVVEEFTFGENRVVAIGPIEALRVSGWEDRTFVVETLDDAGSLLRETWRMDNDVLIRNIRISKKDKEIYSLQQSFERA